MLGLPRLRRLHTIAAGVAVAGLFEAMPAIPVLADPPASSHRHSHSAAQRCASCEAMAQAGQSPMNSGAPAPLPAMVAAPVPPPTASAADSNSTARSKGKLRLWPFGKRGQADASPDQELRRTAVVETPAPMAPMPPRAAAPAPYVSTVREYQPPAMPRSAVNANVPEGFPDPSVSERYPTPNPNAGLVQAPPVIASQPRSQPQPQPQPRSSPGQMVGGDPLPAFSPTPLMPPPSSRGAEPAPIGAMGRVNIIGPAPEMMSSPASGAGGLSPYSQGYPPPYAAQSAMPGYPQGESRAVAQRAVSSSPSGKANANSGWFKWAKRSKPAADPNAAPTANVNAPPMDVAPYAASAPPAANPGPSYGMGAPMVEMGSAEMAMGASMMGMPTPAMNDGPAAGMGSWDPTGPAPIANYTPQMGAGANPGAGYPPLPGQAGMGMAATEGMMGTGGVESSPFRGEGMMNPRANWSPGQGWTPPAPTYIPQRMGRRSVFMRMLGVPSFSGGRSRAHQADLEARRAQVIREAAMRDVNMVPASFVYPSAVSR